MGILVQIMAAGGQSYFELKNGAPKMPRLALGTWKSPPQKTKQAVLTAVRAGYRFIDCANDYDNEHVIGEALQQLFKEGVVQRSDLFIQAKLWNSNHRPEHVEIDLDATLKDLQLDYIDSFVIHWPMACPSTGKNRPIGLSNFNRTQVQEILDIPGAKYKPAVLQNESHPYLQEKDLRDFCRLNGIAFQAYSALGSADRPWLKEGSLTSGLPTTGYEVLSHPLIVYLAWKHGKTTANIVIRWHLQMNGCLVTKSVTPSRIEGNFNVWDFELSPEDMNLFNDLNVGWRYLLWAETSVHADYPFKDYLPNDYVLGKPGKGSTAGATN